jgi:hypothetical protein
MARSRARLDEAGRTRSELVAMKAILVILSATTALSACATKSNNIAPAYASRALYDPLTCPEIRGETNQVVSRLNTLSGVQNKKATTDAVLTGVGVVLF